VEEKRRGEYTEMRSRKAMGIERKSYTEEFKRETVRLLESSGKSVQQLANDLGVDENNLYRWRNQYGTKTGTAGEKPKRNQSELESELKRLQRENEVLRQERDILKKAMSIVSRQQP
jgi:transposase